MPKKWTESTDEELASEAHTGLTGQGAVVEAMRRLRVSTEDLKVSTEKYSRRLIVLTWVLIVLTLVLAIPVVRELLHRWLPS
jgi:hypothetical protein